MNPGTGWTQSRQIHALPRSESHRESRQKKNVRVIVKKKHKQVCTNERNRKSKTPTPTLQFNREERGNLDKKNIRGQVQQVQAHSALYLEERARRPARHMVQAHSELYLKERAEVENK